MKTRLGYVSNSSSSSFTCNICGRTESGYDLTLEEIGMLVCECGECYCEKHMMSATKVSDALKALEKYKDDEEISDLYQRLSKMDKDCIFSQNTSSDDWNDFVSFFKNLNGCDYMPSCLCPFCNMGYISDTDMLDYVLHECNLEKDRVENEMKFRFQNRDELVEFLKGGEEK